MLIGGVLEETPYEVLQSQFTMALGAMLEDLNIPSMKVSKIGRCVRTVLDAVRTPLVLCDFTKYKGTLVQELFYYTIFCRLF